MFRSTATPRRGSLAPPSDGEGAGVARLFSVHQLEDHARELAARHLSAAGRSRRPDPLLPRLAANQLCLQRAHALLSTVADPALRLTPAAEWFVDNYPLIEEQIRTARRHLPADFSRGLPRLGRGIPCVYELALELVSHSHGRVAIDSLGAYVEAYQSVRPLTLGELWAVPIMLRLSLIENLVQVLDRVTTGRHERERATARADSLIAVSGRDPSHVVLVLAELVAEDLPLTNAFVSELASRLQGQGAALAICRNRLVDALKGLLVPISGTLGWDHAEVTSGGLALTEVDRTTLAVRGHPGLYVIGELLDLTGPIGGLNFQAAFSTAEVAGRHAASPP